MLVHSLSKSGRQAFLIGLSYSDHGHGLCGLVDHTSLGPESPVVSGAEKAARISRLFGPSRFLCFGQQRSWGNRLMHVTVHQNKTGLFQDGLGEPNQYQGAYECVRGSAPFGWL